MSLPTLVREDDNTYTHHDQLFKELIHTFFEDFFEAFFPEFHAFIDFQTVKTLPEEDLPVAENRRPVIAVETKFKDHEAIIFIHLEPHNYTQKNNEHIYHYFSMLFRKYQKLVIPIVIFSSDEQHNPVDEFTVSFPFFHVLTFRFFKVELQNLNWRDYIKMTNPVAAALISKMGYAKTERIEVKKEFLRMLVRMELDPARQRLIYGFFERYLKLNDQEEVKLMEEIRKMDDAEKIMEIPISYEEKGKKKGIEQGIRQVAQKMLKEGYTIDSITKVTNLSSEEVMEINRKL